MKNQASQTLVLEAVKASYLAQALEAVEACYLAQALEAVEACDDGLAVVARVLGAYGAGEVADGAGWACDARGLVRCAGERIVETLATLREALGSTRGASHGTVATAGTAAASGGTRAGTVRARGAADAGCLCAHSIVAVASWGAFVRKV